MHVYWGTVWEISIVLVCSSDLLIQVGRNLPMSYHSCSCQAGRQGPWTSGLPFLALLCATAQQSYCRHAGVRPSVRRPSVKPVFSEPVMQINAIFGGKVPFLHISRTFFFFFFQNFAFLIFYDFFSFSLTWDHMAEKNFKRHLLWNYITDSLPKIHAYS